MPNEIMKIIKRVIKILAVLGAVYIFGIYIWIWWFKYHEGQGFRAETMLYGIEASLKLYYLENGVFPTTQEGLLLLVEKPSQHKGDKKDGYLPGPLLDPYINAFDYIQDQEDVLLYTGERMEKMMAVKKMIYVFVSHH